MRNQLLLLAMLFTACVSAAQERFVEGYIVRASGDTVKGYIAEDMNSHLAEKVSFKTSASDNAVPLTVKDVRAFGIDGTVFRALSYFDEVDSMQKERFGKLLVEGHYTLYVLYYGVAEHYFYATSKEGKNFFLFDDVMGNTDAARQGNYRNDLYFIGQSCANTLNQVEAMGFSESDVAKFVQQANRCLEPGQASAIHFKKGRTEMEGVYLFAGGLPLGGGVSELMGQLLVRLVNPALSRKASLNIGVSYWNHHGAKSVSTSSFYTQEDQSNTEVYSIPVQLQYNFTSSRFQPYFYTGFAFLYRRDMQTTKLTGIGANSFGSTSKSQAGLSVPIGVGIDVYATSHLIIRADLRYELFLQYPAVGLAYRF